MLRLIILFTFFLHSNCYSQTELYLQKANSNESIENIVKLLNLKRAKKIYISYEKKGKKTLLGEITLNKEGICVKKTFSDGGNIIFHKYDDNSNVIEYKHSYTFNEDFIHSLSKYDKKGRLIENTYNKKSDDDEKFSHTVNKYNKKGDLIKVIYKDKFGVITKVNDNEENLMTNQMIALMLDNVTVNVPTYKGNLDNRTYNSSGYLIKYFAKGFQRNSSFSREDQEGFKNNELEYRFEYNKENQIIKFYKRWQTTSTMAELTTEFNYINDNIIEVKSDRTGHRFPNESLIFHKDNLLYKIEY